MIISEHWWKCVVGGKFVGSVSTCNYHLALYRQCCYRKALLQECMEGRVSTVGITTWLNSAAINERNILFITSVVLTLCVFGNDLWHFSDNKGAANVIKLLSTRQRYQEQNLIRSFLSRINCCSYLWYRYQLVIGYSNRILSIRLYTGNIRIPLSLSVKYVGLRLDTLRTSSSQYLLGILGKDSSTKATVSPGPRLALDIQTSLPDCQPDYPKHPRRLIPERHYTDTLHEVLPPLARFQDTSLISALGRQPNVIGESWIRPRRTLSLNKTTSNCNPMAGSRPHLRIDVYKRQSL